MRGGDKKVTPDEIVSEVVYHEDHVPRRPMRPVDWSRATARRLLVLVFTGTTQCDRGPPPYPVICIKGSFSWSGGVQNSADWTAGYAKGTTVITLSNTANLTAGENFLILDQVDDTTDGGDIYNCGVAGGCVGQGSDGMRNSPGGYRNHLQVA